MANVANTIHPYYNTSKIPTLKAEVTKCTGFWDWQDEWACKNRDNCPRNYSGCKFIKLGGASNGR